MTRSIGVTTNMDILDTTSVRIPPLAHDEWTDAAREAFAFWGEPGAWEGGSKSNLQMVLANHPPLAMAFNNFGKHLFKESNSSLRARELVILRTAWHTRTIYEWHYHVGYALNLGMTLDEVAAIGVGPAAGLWNEFDRGVLLLVDELWQTSRVSDTTWSTLTKHLDKCRLMDLVFTAGQYSMLGWAIAAFGIQLEEGVDRIGFDLKTRSGMPPTGRAKPGEVEDGADHQYAK
jgi:4-carboxymuconolactone decarboxylase